MKIDRQCAVSACQTPATGFSTLCERHKRNQRRHGDPQQEGVTVHELNPYRLRVVARQAKNPDSPAWPLLAERWEALVKSASGTVSASLKGMAQVSFVVKAAEQVQLIDTAVQPKEVIETVLAMFLLREGRPGRFRSDKAFSFELARRVRGLTDSNAGTYWDAQSGKIKRVYRDLTPRAMEVLAGQLAGAFGGVGLFMAGLERAEVEQAQTERRNLSKALGELK